jgi:hypothetical protein
MRLVDCPLLILFLLIYLLIYKSGEVFSSQYVASMIDVVVVDSDYSQIT